MPKTNLNLLFLNDFLEIKKHLSSMTCKAKALHL